MAVLVKNESSTPWVFERSAGQRQIAAGQVLLISDEEWQSIITAKRGPGAVRALWPAEVTADNLEMNFDYADVGGGDFEVIYMGWATQASDPATDVWTIKKFTYGVVGSANKVTQIQVLENVAWSNRATLGWS